VHVGGGAGGVSVVRVGFAIDPRYDDQPTIGGPAFVGRTGLEPVTDGL
jgi:hypothetical protein